MSLQALPEQALRLPREERRALALALLESVEAPTARFEALSEGAFEAEMQRRAEHALRHPEDGIAWSEFESELDRVGEGRDVNGQAEKQERGP